MICKIIDHYDFADNRSHSLCSKNEVTAITASSVFISVNSLKMKARNRIGAACFLILTKVIVNHRPLNLLKRKLLYLLLRDVFLYLMIIYQFFLICL